MGEGAIPRQNAVLYMSMLEIFVVGGVTFILAGFGININLNVIILSGVALVLLLNYLTLSKRIFDSKYDEYRFLAGISKRRRLWLFFSIIMLAGILNIFGAFLFAL